MIKILRRKEENSENYFFYTILSLKIKKINLKKGNSPFTGNV